MVGLHFNPRPPCGGRPVEVVLRRLGASFQSTSPVWRTTYRVRYLLIYLRFQSTSPVWRTTSRLWSFSLYSFISIHVPRVEDDATAFFSSSVAIYFNPRPPCGGRRAHSLAISSLYEFQSTSPVWRTTRTTACFIATKTISIHVPRVEDDRPTRRPRMRRRHFNPRPPCGGRPM